MSYNFKPSYLEPQNDNINYYNRPRPQLQVELDKILVEEESDETHLSENSCSSTQTANNETISVFLRLRPNANDVNSINYRVDNNVLIATNNIDDNSKNKDISEKHYSFTTIFDKSVPQAELYNNSIYNSISNNNNTTVLVYGTSGSGKTFTLLGDMDSPGIVPRTLSQIFTEYSENISQQPVVKFEKGGLKVLDDDQIKNEEILRKSLITKVDNLKYNIMRRSIKKENVFKSKELTDITVYVWISFAEIYNENIYDLLDPIYDKENQKNRRRLRIIKNEGRAYIKDLTSVFVKNTEEAYELLYYGINQVQYASTAINSTSSRSHCIFFIDVIVFSPPEHLSYTTYKLCDLAGSERLKKTANIGSRLKEAQQINTSLMVLGRCLSAVHQHQKKNSLPSVVPYRDSKLTMLIQNALLGREKLTLIVNLLPDKTYFEENLNVLNFASIAKKIVQIPKNLLQNNRITRYSMFYAQATSSPRKSNNEISSLVEENMNLRTENDHLKEELAELKHTNEIEERRLRGTLVDNFQERYNRMNELWEQRLEQIKAGHQQKVEELEEKYDELLQDYEDLENEYKNTEIE